MCCSAKTSCKHQSFCYNLSVLQLPCELEKNCVCHVVKVMLPIEKLDMMTEYISLPDCSIRVIIAWLFYDMQYVISFSDILYAVVFNMATDFGQDSCIQQLLQFVTMYTYFVQKVLTHNYTTILIFVPRRVQY